MGKTHLMHAIGRELDRPATARMRMIYTSSERFMNEMIACIRTERMPQFHQRYREADVLLIDDIQLLGNKERTQEEFFHTFNELHDHQKQIVISSDSPPKDIPGLVERLRSRFEWGLMADIQPPDLETKMAILDKKAEVGRRQAAGRCAHVHGVEDQIECARAGRRAGQADRLFLADRDADQPADGAAGPEAPGARAGPAESPSIRSRKRWRSGSRSSSRSSRKRATRKKIVYPRQVAMYLVKELTDASLPEIGRAFGGKHHTTVIHSINKIEQQRHNDPELNRLLHSLMDSLQ